MSSKPLFLFHTNRQMKFRFLHLFRSRLLLGTCGLALFILCVWFSMPLFVADPIPGVWARTPVRTWCDRNGRPLYCERTWQYEWRFDVPLSSIPKDVVDVMLAVEDTRFFKHGGIDYRSVCRAILQNIAAGRIISGASTISMQTAAMDYHSGRRGFVQKFIQSAKTRKMEMCHSKEEILEAYFNNLPFGGNIYGIEAASRFYFGLHASELGIAEASILCGLPQRPNRLRPDRHPFSARKRQGLVLDRLVASGLLTTTEAGDIYRRRPRYRDFSLPASFEQIGSPREWGFLIETGTPMHHGDPQLVNISVDSVLSHRIKSSLSRTAAKFHDVHDAASVVIDIATGEIIAYVGTLDFDSPRGGQIDAAKSLRSAGSALKPFIYLEALLAGRLAAESSMLDAPVRYGGYSPENYGGGYSGSITATEALSRSLNTPAIRLLASLGLKRVEQRFASLGLATPGQVADNGLSLALGTAGYRLRDIVNAYASIAPRANALSPQDFDACAMLAEMLRTRSLPGTSLPVAWKTGTSNDNRDAWCFGYTCDYAVGVWFGNKDGSRSSALVGAEIAAPVVGEIFESLYSHRPSPVWPFSPDFAEDAMLCARSGLRAASTCTSTVHGRVLRHVPLALCESCTGHKPHLSIVSPHPGEYMLADGALSLSLPLSAGTAHVTWFIDGEMLKPEAKSADFTPGRHDITAIPLDSNDEPAKIAITVVGD